MAEQVRKRNEPDYRRKKNETRKDRQDEVVRQRGRHLQGVMPYHILVGTQKSPLNAASAHRPNIVLPSSMGKYPKNGREYSGDDGYNFNIVLLIFEVDQDRVISTFQKQVSSNLPALEAAN